MAVPSVQAFRRNTYLILAAFGLPYVGAVALGLVVHFWWPPASPTSLQYFGVLGPFILLLTAGWEVIRKWVRRARPGRSKPVSMRIRDTILREFPELKAVSFLSATDSNELAINGGILRMGSALQGSVGRGHEPIDPQLFFLLAHETRHFQVDVLGSLTIFRALKNAYQLAAIGFYCSFLLNWAATWDTQNRTATTIYLCLLPYLWAALRYLLSEALAAFEWKLEIDADRAARERCERTNRPLPDTRVWRGLHRSRPMAAAHPPLLLRIAGIQGMTDAARTAGTVLFAGWVIAIAPLALIFLISVVEWNDPDPVRIVIGIGILLVFAAATATIITAMTAGSQIPGADHKPTMTVFEATSLVMLRVNFLAARLLFGAAAPFALVFVFFLAWKMWNGDVPPPVDAVFAIATFLAAGAYFGLGWRTSLWAIVAAGAAEWMRLFAGSWFMRGTAKLPVVRDTSGLGEAISARPDLIYVEMVDLWVHRPFELFVYATASAAFAGAIAMLSYSGLRADRRSGK